MTVQTYKASVRVLHTPKLRFSKQQNCLANSALLIGEKLLANNNY